MNFDTDEAICDLCFEEGVHATTKVIYIGVTNKWIPLCPKHAQEIIGGLTIFVAEEKK